MLLKYTTGQSSIGKSGKGKGKLIRNNGIRIGNIIGINNRIHRKTLRLPGKRPHPGKLIARSIAQPSPTCDNSNDSGLGLEAIHCDRQYNRISFLNHTLSQNFNRTTYPSASSSPEFKDEPSGGPSKYKRPRLGSIHFESEDACSNDSFTLVQEQQQKQPITSHTINYCATPSTAASQSNIQITPPNKLSSMSKRMHGAASTSAAQPPEGSISKDGKVQIQILQQPESQHRARYQTEGSRGSIKDRRGVGFPLIKLIGYNKPTKLQIYIGTDAGSVEPHMFYQACKVSSKNSTPCTENKIDGTVIIEVEFKPENDMVVTCDCVGILKERNVDVEHRFPHQQPPKNKKKSTRCRMVFKTEIINANNEKETLQICSQPIVCTQPPGVPEICRKSLSECTALGGQDLFIIGKNFHKDTKIIFKCVKKGTFNTIWEESVAPEQEFLHQQHLICQIPPYFDPDIVYPVNVKLFITSNNKQSESHNFTYLPQRTLTNAVPQLNPPTTTTGTTIQPVHGKSMISKDDISIFASTDEYTKNAMNDLESPNHNREHGSCQLGKHIMLPPTVSLMPMDLQSQPSHIEALAAVKAELLEETSQSSITSPTESLPPVFSKNNMEIEQENVPLEFISQEIIGLGVKPELDRRNSLSQDGFVQVTNSVNPTIFVAPNPDNNESMFASNLPVALCAETNMSFQPNGPLSLVSSTPVSQDVLLQSAQTPIVIPQTVVSQNHNTAGSSDNILDTSLAPTMMCHGIDTSNVILSTPTLPPTPNMLPTMSAVISTTATPEQPLEIPQKTSPVAVKNMILSAAADILSSPEPTPETRSTINALMALNTDAILGVTPTTSVEPVNQNSPVQVPNIMHGHNPPETAATTTVSNNLQTIVEPQITKHNNVSIREQVELKVETCTNTSNVPQQMQAVTSTTVQTSIPQEIATMSESDLISFINPNAFDQV